MIKCRRPSGDSALTPIVDSLIVTYSYFAGGKFSSHVCGLALKDNEITWRVVLPVAINMMDSLTFQKATPYHLLRHGSVNGNAPLFWVAFRVQALVSTPAWIGAKLALSIGKHRKTGVERQMAIGATMGGPASTSGCVAYLTAIGSFRGFAADRACVHRITSGCIISDSKAISNKWFSPHCLPVAQGGLL